MPLDLVIKDTGLKAFIRNSDTRSRCWPGLGHSNRRLGHLQAWKKILQHANIDETTESNCPLFLNWNKPFGTKGMFHKDVLFDFSVVSSSHNTRKKVFIASFKTFRRRRCPEMFIVFLSRCLLNKDYRIAPSSVLFFSCLTINLNKPFYNFFLRFLSITINVWLYTKRFK